ncbi:hypothetical protein J31TS4_18890 [Paenibacillus sp. J31TS4]|uniref:hypothetical protein n=1 Tax=Paenibacillus sp. J31TS4 TaxID=2807195 RepID=UPI001B15B290|nr:hypothetical protein [Paenibacillus sp. J31TS4]GIP38609.1 hypothetical protein J31TS4_18890 [Paenibacillus sp. J31TS4]
MGGKLKAEIDAAIAHGERCIEEGISLVPQFDGRIMINAKTEFEAEFIKARLHEALAEIEAAMNQIGVSCEIRMFKNKEEDIH